MLALLAVLQRQILVFLHLLHFVDSTVSGPEMLMAVGREPWCKRRLEEDTPTLTDCTPTTWVLVSLGAKEVERARQTVWTWKPKVTGHCSSKDFRAQHGGGILV